MKIVMGKMWDSMSGSRTLRVLRCLMILPALVGAFICYMIFWSIHVMCPNAWTLSATLGLLMLYGFAETHVWIDQWRSSKLDVEASVRCLGILFAMIAGFWIPTR